MKKLVVLFITLSLFIYAGGGITIHGAYVYEKTYYNLSLIYDDQNDTWGRSLAFSGDYFVIGSSEATGSTTSNAGSIRVYNTSTNTNEWNKINPNIRGTAGGDNFSRQLVALGDKLFVSAHGEDGITGKTQNGTIYVYDITDGTHLGQIENPDIYTSNTHDKFGIVMAGNDRYLMVSATREDTSLLTDVGAVYIFDTTTHDLVYTLQSPDHYGLDTSRRFGLYLSITDDYFLIGDPYENNSTLNGMGVVYVYDINTGILLHTIENPNPHNRSPYAYDDSEIPYGFGIVEANTNHIVISDPQADTSTITGRSGKVYIYNPNTFQLRHTVENPYGEENLYGTTMALETSVLVIGTFRFGITHNINSGNLSVINANLGEIDHFIQNYNHFGDEAGDYFGKTLALDNLRLGVGAPRDYNIQTFQGTVYTFILDDFPPLYTVTFNSNGGTLIDPITQIEAGTLIEKPVDPTKMGVNFVGWYKDSELKQQWNFNSDVVNDDITLHAKWSEDIISRIDGNFEDTFIDSVFGKVFLSILLVVAFTIILAIITLPKMIILLVDVLLLMLFIAIGWIPLWIIFAITFVVIGLIVMLNKGGGTDE